jgi:hypothetical protein
MKKPRSILKCLLVLTVSGLSGCGSGSPSTSASPQEQAPPDKQSTPTFLSQSQSNRPDFQYFSVIREFGDDDTAALFGLLPNKQGMKITGITGPLFLGHALVKVLHQETLGDLFSHSSLPMTQPEKKQLLSRYSGAQIIYFEKYQGQLCTDQDLSLTVTSTLGEWSPTLTFKFSAIANPNDDCRFHSLGLETAD